MLSLAFDVYGTLIDTNGLLTILQRWLGNRPDAEAFSQTWRDTQLTYSFRRGLMSAYQPFSVCTQQALDFACQQHDVCLSQTQKARLLAGYRTLPAFAEVKAALTKLQRHPEVSLYAFSNGEHSAVKALLAHADINDCFTDIISCQSIRTFKPDPAVYRWLLKQTQSTPAHTWLISSNSFDVIGAKSAGLKAAWVQRDDTAVFDPWGILPDQTVSDLHGIAALV